MVLTMPGLCAPAIRNSSTNWCKNTERCDRCSGRTIALIRRSSSSESPIGIMVVAAKVML